MTQALMDRGLDVVGVDASASMLARARVLLGDDVLLEHAALPELPAGVPLDGPFDAAVSTLDGLNYLSLPDLRAALGALATRLRPGGWLVFDLHADAALDLLRDNPVLEGQDDGTRFVLRSFVDDATRRCVTVIDLVAADPADSFSEEHVQYVHAEADVRAALSDAGLGLVSVTDEYTDEPVTASTLRATWVARLVES